MTNPFGEKMNRHISMWEHPNKMFSHKERDEYKVNLIHALLIKIG